MLASGTGKAIGAGLCFSTCFHLVSHVAQWLKNPPATQETQETWFDPWVKEIPWSRAWLPTSGFSPGESHGQRSLEGYSPWVAESDVT